MRWQAWMRSTASLFNDRGQLIDEIDALMAVSISASP
jgi:hypothetical protein